MLHKKKIYCITDEPDNAKSKDTIQLRSGGLKVPGGCNNSEKCPFKPFLGLFYTSLTSLFITLSSVYVKKLTYINPGQLSMIRNIGVWVGCLPIAIYCVSDIFGSKNEQILLFVRGLLVATALYLNLLAYRFLPLAEASIVMSTMPAITTVMARVYLKEHCGLVQGFALVITLCGVLLSVRLPEILNNENNSELDSDYIVGLASAVGSVLIFSVSIIALRKMKHVHFSVSLLHIGFVGMLANGAISLSTSSLTMPQCGSDQILVMLIGFFGFIGHCSMTRAIQIEDVGIVTVMKTSVDIVVALIFQVVFFSSNPDVYNISGAFLVIASVSVIGLNKWFVTLPEESKTRKRFKYLLL